MSIGLHSDVPSMQTRDCILLQPADVDLWLNSMDWCGSNFYDLHTSVDRMRCRTRAWEQHCGVGHPRSSPPPLPSSNRHQQRLEQGGCYCWVGKVQIKECVCSAAAAACCRLAAYGGLSNDRPWDNYCRSPLYVCLVRSVASNACMRRVLVHDIVRSLADTISQGRRICNRYHDIV